MRFQGRKTGERSELGRLVNHASGKSLGRRFCLTAIFLSGAAMYSNYSHRY